AAGAFDRDGSLRPLHARHDRGEAQLDALRIESGAQPFEHRVVAAGETELAAVFLLFIGGLQRERADAVGVRGVIALDEPAGERALSRRESPLRAYELGERDVALQRADAPAHAVDGAPIIADARAASVCRPPVIVPKRADGERRGVDDGEARLGLAMQE